MKIALTGATGFLGARLLHRLLADGHELSVLGRSRSPSLPPNVRFAAWDSTTGEPPAESLSGAGAVIHLAGEPVARRWNEEVKRRIRTSRVDGTRSLVCALSKLSPPPAVLVNASAIGFYGSRGDELLTEESSAGGDFLAQLTQEWEAAADGAEALGIRVVKLRTGIVLGNGGALTRMLLPFRLGLGGRLGSGHHWMSWIHIDDTIELIRLAASNPSVRGPLNLTAPNPVRNREFTSALAQALHRPAVFPVPELAVRALFGEMAGVILASQRVLPKAALDLRYPFRFPHLAEALAAIVASR